MSRAYSERWEVRWSGGAYVVPPGGDAQDARDYRSLLPPAHRGPIVRVRVFRVPSVYAWRFQVCSSPDMRDMRAMGIDWWEVESGWGRRVHRTLYPTRAAALAARPSADAVLVRIRRRVSE